MELVLSVLNLHTGMEPTANAQRATPGNGALGSLFLYKASLAANVKKGM